MIETGGERGSGISVLAARHDNDDDKIQYKKFGVKFDIFQYKIQNL